MGKTGLLALLIVLAALGLISAIRALEALVAGGLNSYTIGQVTAGAVLAVLFFWGARKALAKYRAT